MATWYASGNGDVFDANLWATTAGGAGSATLGVLPATDALDLNGKTLTWNATTNPTITQILIQASGATGTLTPTGTGTINGSIAYSGTLTAGMIQIGTGAAIQINGTAATPAVDNTAGGYAIITTGTGSCSISNVGGTALRAIVSGGRALSKGSSSVTSIVGNVVCDCAGYGLRIGAGTVNFDGLPLVEDFSNTAVYGAVATVTGGTLNWTGARTISASQFGFITILGGTVNLTSLVLQNYGNVLITKKTTGPTLTLGTGATRAKIYNMNPQAQCILGGFTDTEKNILNFSMAYGPYPVTASAVGPYPIGSTSVGPYPSQP
jgi:hypothetical protein